MTYTPTSAGTITKESPLISIERLSVTAATNIVKGNVCTIVSGFIIKAPTTQVAGSPWFVALENADNSGGASGDISVPLAKRGHYVTCLAGGVIKPGDPVKTDTGTAGRVIAFVKGTDAEGLKVGYYIGKEGGTIAKAVGSPYLELYTDSADFVPVDSATNDVIEIELI